MGEKAVDAVLRNSELGIVEIVGVNRDAIREGGEAGHRAQTESQLLTENQQPQPAPTQKG